MSFAWSGSLSIRPLSTPALACHCLSLLPAMNPNFLPLSLVAAVGLLIAPQTSEASVYTFDVDVSSGIGSGSFCLDLPDSWPGNIGHSTIFQAFSVRGFFARGDRWISLSVTLNEPLDFQPDNAELSGACRRTPSFKCPTKGIGLTPSEAVANIPGITLRPLVLSQSDIKGQRRSPLLEKARVFKSDWYGSRQNSRLTGGTF